MKRIPIIIPVVFTSVFLTACHIEDQPNQQAKIQESAKAAQAANSIQFNQNAEIDNIKKRLELTSNPGQIGFIILLNEMGQPIIYESVVGKVTSGGKRLTPPKKLWNVDKGEFMGTEVHDAPSDEGTWGSSSHYIYYWTVNGEYRQWNGSYLYSDKPFRLRVEPLVVNIVSEKSNAKQ